MLKAHWQGRPPACLAASCLQNNLALLSGLLLWPTKNYNCPYSSDQFTKHSNDKADNETSFPEYTGGAGGCFGCLLLLRSLQTAPRNSSPRAPLPASRSSQKYFRTEKAPRFLKMDSLLSITAMLENEVPLLACVLWLA